MPRGIFKVTWTLVSKKSESDGKRKVHDSLRWKVSSVNLQCLVNPDTLQDILPIFAIQFDFSSFKPYMSLSETQWYSTFKICKTEIRDKLWWLFFSNTCEYKMTDHWISIPTSQIRQPRYVSWFWLPILTCFKSKSWI